MNNKRIAEKQLNSKKFDLQANFSKKLQVRGQKELEIVKKVYKSLKYNFFKYKIVSLNQSLQNVEQISSLFSKWNIKALNITFINPKLYH